MFVNIQTFIIKTAAMKVTILLTEQLSLFELACAVELFALPRTDFESWYKTQIVSLTDSALNGLCGTSFSCKLVSKLPETDLLVIPSFPVHTIEINPKLAQEVEQHYASGGRIISFCSGSFLLAKLGILDERVATTHWRYAAQFRQQFPQIEYKDDILYAYDGVIGCSAGSAAGIDLGIEVIRRDFGYSHANSVARQLVLPAHRNGGQSQFVEKAVTQTKSTISQTLDWAVKNLSSEITIDSMAKKANMTRRTFDRHVKRHYKMTPLEWLSERKLEVAKSLLETTVLSIENIAVRSGFETAMTLRHNFKKSLSISPSEYRTTFHSSGKN